MEMVETGDNMEELTHSNHYINKIPTLRFHFYGPKEHVIQVLNK